MRKILIIIFLAPFFLFSQQGKIDSLKLDLTRDQRDTSQIKTLNSLAWKLKSINPDTAIILSTQALQLSIKIKWNKGIANSEGALGEFNWRKGNFGLSLEHHHKALEIYEELSSSPEAAIAKLGKSGKAKTIGNIGNVYTNQGDYPKALSCYFAALKTEEEIGNKKGTAIDLGNIGLVYCEQGDYIKALDYLTRAIKISEEIKDKNGTSRNFGNIANVYYYQHDYNRALNFYFKALKIAEEQEDRNGIARHLGNIGSVYKDLADYAKALDYNFKALKMEEEMGNQIGIAIDLGHIGSLYTKMGKFKNAEEYLKKSLNTAESIGSLDDIKSGYQNLSNLYDTMGNVRLAFDNFKKYVSVRDSINNDESKKEQVRTEVNFEYEKKATSDSVRVGEEKKVISAQLKEEETKSYALYGGLGLVMIFAGFMVNRFRVTNKQKKIIEIKEQETQKQNEIISHQKNLVEEKHLEITDSINYAERIQSSMLASKHLFNENSRCLSNGAFKDEKGYFVFFKPKDVVSGDFYWASKLSYPGGGAYGGGAFCLVTADSTGHGVPGAIMSMLNMNSLKEAVTKGLTEADDILNYTRNIIINTLSNDGSKEGGKDGMDCSLLIFDYKTMNLNWVAANNPVWIVRETEVIELKPQKMPVGRHDKQNEPFVKQTFQLQKGDVIYAITDGYPDQFGGKKGKKFMSKNLKELLKNNAHLPMPEQKIVIAQTFKNWVGNLEQVDDVTIIGIKV